MRSYLDRHPVLRRRRLDLLVAVSMGLLGAACASEPGPPATPIVPGTQASPREVNLIARDYAFVPASLELVPGETVLLHVVNAGLVVHEAVIGDASVQDAWEAAEAAVAGAPPGPTPRVSVPPGVAGIRVVAGSGERVDVTFTVPARDATGEGVAGEASGAGGADAGWLVGCHIPGHLAKGMQVPVRWIEPQSVSAPSDG